MSLFGVIRDVDGNPIHAAQDADGDYHLCTAAIQEIITSTNNFTTANLASGASFTGSADETLGINGIQVYHAADQDCTVYLDQGIDNTFASSSQTITDSFICLANEPCSRTYTSVSPYYRIRVVNIDLDGEATTKLVTATGMTPIINTLPRSLSPQGNLQVVASLRGDENYDRHAWINPTSELAVSPVYRMVGTAFGGVVKDPNFWTDDSLRDGTVTQDGGEIELNTNTTANGQAKYTTVNKARFVAGSAQLFTAAVNFVTTGSIDNIRRVGAYTSTGSVVEDGFFFELSGSTFSIATKRSGSAAVKVDSGDFNGNIGQNFVPVADTYYKLSVEFTPLSAFWYVDDSLLHKIKAAHKSNTLTLPVTLENENVNDSVAPIGFDCVGAYIARQGEITTNPISKYILTGTEVLKYGAGVLRRIIVSDNIGGVIIYDNTVAGGKIITDLDTSQGTEPLGSVEFDIPFSDGLTIVITDDVGVTVVYE